MDVVGPIPPPPNKDLTKGLGNGVRTNGVRNRVYIDDVGLILNVRMAFFDICTGWSVEVEFPGFGDVCSFRDRY